VIEVCHETIGAHVAPIAFVSVKRASARELARLLRTAVAARDLSIGGRLGAVCAQAEERKLFDLTLLSRGFPVFASRNEALRSWR
jgi:hypothetical protein